MAPGGLVGRQRELHALAGALDDARSGTGRVVVCAGEPGIGKTRLASELAGRALAAGVPVAWGRCAGDEGAPAFWPWRSVLRSLGADPDAVLRGDVESPADRFRVFEDVAALVGRAAAGGSGLVIILDDVHGADAPSLLLLRHLAGELVTMPVLVVVTVRSASVPGSLSDVLRVPGAERVDLPPLGMPEVRAQLAALGEGAAGVDAAVVLEVTGGNPLFLREVAGAIADGTWRPDRPPGSVLDVVRARLDRVSPGCRRLVQAAAVIGGAVPADVLADVLGLAVPDCVPLLDETVAADLLRPAGDEHRFVHALTRDAVEASLPAGERLALHRAVAVALEARFAGALSEHLADIARHWAVLAPYGEAATARQWAVRAADDAANRLAHEEAVRLYRSALDLDPATPAGQRTRVLLALGRAARLAGDVRACVDAATAAAAAARAAGRSDLAAEAALVPEAVPDLAVNARTRDLCEEALGVAVDDGTRARLLAQRSHLAYYDGDGESVASLSAAALDLARRSGDDRALVDALHARKEACPGPAGRDERVTLAEEMLAVGRRTSTAGAAMWGHQWRIETMLEAGQLAAAADALDDLGLAADRVGGPVSAWHRDRVAAAVAQATGRYADAAALGRRAFERMRPFEPSSATGAFFALRCALAGHVGLDEDAAELVGQAFEGPPRFRMMGRISRAWLLLRAGRRDEAAAAYRQAGPVDRWSLPAFFVVPGHVYAALVCIELERRDEVAELLERLEPHRGEHASGEGVVYNGPVALALGRAAAALDRLDAAVDDLALAVDQATAAGAPGFVAEGSYHLARALLARNGPGDRERAVAAAADADRLARSLGMTAYLDRTAGLVSRLSGAAGDGLSRRESEVAALVAEGLTNRQIAERLYISERTAQNHVQHILTKLGFSTRSQIAAWMSRSDG